ncbi:cytochrome P450 [Artemisia annua]|uniref:Cytochrome P450 n=1 Tax=Artemisia annua TaxID=35608 RepID=A0A2U1LLG5_ARTAN|nr:cytochrome P450 [Artemisia annua]
MAEACGPIFIVKLGVHQALVVSDAEIVKECFTKNDMVFATRPKSLVVELVGYNYAMFGLAPYGDYWRTMRKMVMIEVLSQRRVEMLSSIRVPEVRTSMKHTCEAWVRNKESTGSNKLQVELKKLFENFQLNIITRTISGKRFSPGDKEGTRVLAVARKFLEFLGTFVVSDFLPYAKCLDLGGYQKEMKKTAKEIDNMFEGWLEEHRKQRESGEHQGESEHDFMNVFISILEGASREEFTGFDHNTMIKATSLIVPEEAVPEQQVPPNEGLVQEPTASHADSSSSVQMYEAEKPEPSTARKRNASDGNGEGSSRKRRLIGEEGFFEDEEASLPFRRRSVFLLPNAPVCRGGWLRRAKDAEIAVCRRNWRRRVAKRSHHKSP